VLNNLALSEAVAGELDKAIATLRRAADLPSATMQTRENLALLLAMKGDTEQAANLTRHDLTDAQAKANIETYRTWATALNR
jgi:Flp pilus assembly protein TadD